MKDSRLAGIARGERYAHPFDLSTERMDAIALACDQRRLDDWAGIGGDFFETSNACIENGKAWSAVRGAGIGPGEAQMGREGVVIRLPGQERSSLLETRSLFLPSPWRSLASKLLVSIDALFTYRFMNS